VDFMTKIKLRSFDKYDWDTFAGATKFPNGANPVVDFGVPSKRDVGSNKVAVLVDRHGIEISTASGSVYSKKKYFSSPGDARRWVRDVLKVPITRTQLKELKFKKIL